MNSFIHSRCENDLFYGFFFEFDKIAFIDFDLMKWTTRQSTKLMTASYWRLKCQNASRSWYFEISAPNLFFKKRPEEHYAYICLHKERKNLWHLTFPKNDVQQFSTEKIKYARKSATLLTEIRYSTVSQSACILLSRFRYRLSKFEIIERWVIERIKRFQILLYNIKS